ncbi:hypothetical protein F4819DRAFT_253710 [Hypoxylon fuscum]|nr:hypothetical protein F4819DRAFT_253710 [Hypoxylon fuscum]
MPPAANLQWPDTPDTVRYLLNIQKADRIRCHGHSKSKSTCGNWLSKTTALRITELVGRIATSCFYDGKVSELVKQLATVVMCRRWHQDQGPSKARAWEQLLKSIHRGPCLVRMQDLSQNHDKPGESSSQVPKPSSSPHDEPTCHRFEPYCRQKSLFEINMGVKHQIMRQLLSTELHFGSIYTFVLPDTHSVNGKPSHNYVKIGCSNNANRRLAEIERVCHYQPRLVGVWEMPNSRRHEKVIHLLLSNTRMSELSGCPVCAVRHREWFKIGRRAVCDLVETWQKWAMLKPYNEDGCLLPMWQDKLTKLDLEKSTCWALFLSNTS